MIQAFKKLPQHLIGNSRKVILQIVLVVSWAIIIAGTFSFLS